MSVQTSTNRISRNANRTNHCKIRVRTHFKRVRPVGIEPTYPTKKPDRKELFVASDTKYKHGTNSFMLSENG